ncbi:hypothetical protein PROPHIGD05-3_19 [Mycobacterium phage prophiGD05-3]|nr:hypothetical protein PROPHIGD05-3_19 [Mycobacterium phage prophiGD05-3]
MKPCPLCKGSGLIQVADVYRSVGAQRNCLVAWELSTPGPCWCTTYGLRNTKEMS